MITLHAIPNHSFRMCRNVGYPIYKVSKKLSNLISIPNLY